MFSSIQMPGFCKNEDCPSSNELVEFEKAELVRTRCTEIRTHLKTCEFCSAEVEFYSHYPQGEAAETAETAQIPAPLYQLAEALLKNRHADSHSLNSLLRENKELVADSVS